MKKIIPFLLFSTFLFSIFGCTSKKNIDHNAKVRPQYALVNFAGIMSFDKSLNPLVSSDQTIKKRRRRLRRGLWGIYELLKGPEIVRPNIAIVTSINSVFGSGKNTKPAVAEMLKLASVDVVSLGTPVLSKTKIKNVKSTLEALKTYEIDTVGLSNSPAVIVDLDIVKVAFLGIHLSNKTKSNKATNIMSVSIEQQKEALSSLKQQVLEARKTADLVFILAGSNKNVAFVDRQKFAYGLIDDAGFDAVLGQRSGNFEGIEKHGKAVIMYSPGFSYISSLSKGKEILSFVYKIHVDKTGVKWIESQPINVSRKKTIIGMGEKETYQHVDNLILKSKKLKTTVVNEHGRAIWDNK